MIVPRELGRVATYSQGTLSTSALSSWLERLFRTWRSLWAKQTTSSVSVDMLVKGLLTEIVTCRHVAAGEPL